MACACGRILTIDETNKWAQGGSRHGLGEFHSWKNCEQTDSNTWASRASYWLSDHLRSWADGHLGKMTKLVETTRIIGPLAGRGFGTLTVTSRRPTKPSKQAQL